MPEKKKKFETQFLNALHDIFVGARVEGDSGYINLMRIKSRYYEQGIFPLLMKDIDQALQPFPDFREELFDKLYTFFQRYFSESGSIYFRYTPLHQNVYEKVYTDNRDVILFWKTHMLYYVKTDRIFTSMNIEVDEVQFFFDAGKMQLKKANEKRQVIFDFRHRNEDGTLVFNVSYSEKGRTTKIDEILKAVHKAGQKLSDETLEKAFRVFEKQSEVDYFINKNARQFLCEQFELWMYQYLFAGRNIWDQARLTQLQVLKEIAFKIIDFISQFEDELVKIWNKPKFVLNSHYVVTIDKINDPVLLDKLLAHPGMQAQLDEWRELGMLEEDFRLDMLKEKDLTGRMLHYRYQFLTLDTKHFSGMELNILTLFEDLDNQLDGWLIHSENYQALNTLLPKFRGRVKCIHIDPPYNTETSGFLYVNTYLHSSWLTMMENRVGTSLPFLTDDGSFLCHIDENEYERLHLLFEAKDLPNAGTVVWDKRNPMNASSGIAKQHEYIIWRSKQTSPIYLRNESVLSMLNAAAEIVRKYGGISDAARKEYSSWIDGNPELSGGEKAYRFLDDEGQVYQSVSLRAPEPRTDQKFFQPLIHPVTQKPCPVPPNGFSRTPANLQLMVQKGEILFGEDETIQPRQKVLLTKDKRRQISSVVEDAHKGKGDIDVLNLDFPYCHPTSLYEKLTGTIAYFDEITLDFFAGSGTTAHAVMNLNRADGDSGNRRYILVEMGEHFNTVILPRVKKVAFCRKWKDGKPVFAKGEGGMSHFVKYYDLEQYEDVLSRARYQDADLFDNPYEDPYHSYIFLRDLKMLEALEVDREKNSVHFHPEHLYPGPSAPGGISIDLAETLSHLRGKWIKRITAEYVEFQDGERLSLSDPDWRIFKPMVWWG
jgi:adenine-specific DNA-methyltransferase